MLSEDLLNHIRRDCSLLDLVSSYTSVTRKGCNYMGLCPFHSEKTPSFCVYQNTNSFYCFGCGVGGDIIQFVMLAENLCYPDAVEFLAYRMGLQFDGKSSNYLSERKSIFEINRSAAKFFHSNLSHESEGMRYFTSRGLSEKIIKRFGLGCTSLERNSLVNFLIEKGFSKENILKSNLGLEYKGKLRDRFINRVIFPIIDTKGNIIAFGARTLTDKLPKYLNSSDTLVFKKSNNLFSLNFAKKEKYFILVEGYMDVISLNQIGFRSAVASLGTALTKEQSSLISRYVQEVYICYDSDDAGKKATNRAIKLLEDQHLVVKIISIPNAKDPDEFIKLDISSAKSRFQSLIDNSKNVVDYKSSELEKKYDLSKAEEKVLFLKNLSNIVSKIYDPIERDIYLSRICSKYGISKDAFGISVEKNFKKSEQMEFNKPKMSKNREKSSNLHIEEFLISCIIRNTDFVKHVNEFVSDDFCSDLNFRILDTIRNLSSEGKHIDIGSISREFDSMESGEISRIANLNIMDVSESRFLSLVDRFEKKRQIRNFRKFQNLDDDKVLEFLDKLKNSKK